MKQRLLVVFVTAMLAGLCCGLYQSGVFGKSWRNPAWRAGDFTWPILAVRDLAAGRDPYDRQHVAGIVGYPLTAAVVAVPLAWLPLEVAAGIFTGLSTGLLTWGLLRDGNYWRLWILASYPFWQCVQVANWSILMLAIALVPACYPLLVAKPHTALPILLTRPTPRRVLAAGVIVALSLLLYPAWPSGWLQTIEGYQGRPALLLPFGAVLVLALLRWREPAARFFLLCCLVPLRAFYDFLLLFLIPTSRQSLLLLVTGSWLTYWFWYFWPAAAGVWIVLFLFLPCLGDLLWPVRQRLLFWRRQANPVQAPLVLAAQAQSQHRTDNQRLVNEVDQQGVAP